MVSGLSNKQRPTPTHQRMKPSPGGADESNLNEMHGNRSLKPYQGHKQELRESGNKSEKGCAGSCKCVKAEMPCTALCKCDVESMRNHVNANDTTGKPRQVNVQVLILLLPSAI